MYRGKDTHTLYLEFGTICSFRHSLGVLKCILCYYYCNSPECLHKEKNERSQINDISFYLLTVETKKKKDKLKVNRGKEIIKFKVEINSMENKNYRES